VYRVYIDEAGDRGHRPRSSQHFVVAAVIVRDADELAVRSQLVTLRATVGPGPSHVLHFRNLTHPRKVKACRHIAAMPIAVITGVIVCKRKVAATLPGGGYAYIKQADPMYLYAVRLLLERVSWYIDDHGGGPAIVTFAHLRRFRVAKLHAYRSALEQSPTEIRWNAYAGTRSAWPIPRPSSYCRSADAAASALYSAVEPDAYGNREGAVPRPAAPTALSARHGQHHVLWAQGVPGQRGRVGSAARLPPRSLAQPPRPSRTRHRCALPAPVCASSGQPATRALDGAGPRS
jgi:Protein of unknown function (DUF3800)